MELPPAPTCIYLVIPMRFSRVSVSWVQEAAMPWQDRYITTDMYPVATGYPELFITGNYFIYDWIRGWIKAVTLQSNPGFEQMDLLCQYRFA